jgi:hypothetical protein
VLTVGDVATGYRTITLEQQNNLLLAANGAWIANLGATGGSDANTTMSNYSVHITTGARPLAATASARKSQSRSLAQGCLLGIQRLAISRYSRIA